MGSDSSPYKNVDDVTAMLSVCPDSMHDATSDAQVLAFSKLHRRSATTSREVVQSVLLLPAFQFCTYLRLADYISEQFCSCCLRIVLISRRKSILHESRNVAPCLHSEES